MLVFLYPQFNNLSDSELLKFLVGKPETTAINLLSFFFIELAKEFSEDPGSALNGGELGWSTPDQFVGAFADTMQITEEGQFSEPFLSQFGWHILLVEGRREEDMSDEARRNMALELLHKRRFEEERQEWLKELRDEAFVEIRLPNA